MGNCSGLFANCTDAEGDNVRRIDQDKMQAALAANKRLNEQGMDMMKGMNANLPNAGDQLQYADGFQNNVTDGQYKNFEFRPGVRETRPQIQLDNGAIYEGEWLNGERDGYGVQKWLDGSRYEG